MSNEYNKAKAYYANLIFTVMLMELAGQHMVEKAKAAKCPHKIPYVRLKDTEWGRKFKALYGREWNE